MERCLCASAVHHHVKRPRDQRLVMGIPMLVLGVSMLFGWSKAMIVLNAAILLHHNEPVECFNFCLGIPACLFRGSISCHFSSPFASDCLGLQCSCGCVGDELSILMIVLDTPTSVLEFHCVLAFIYFVTWDTQFLVSNIPMCSKRVMLLYCAGIPMFVCVVDSPINIAVLFRI